MNLQHAINKVFSLILMSWLTLHIVSASAAGQPYASFGDYRVHYSVFNSSFITPDVAKLYNITRGKDRALVNIAVTKSNTSDGLSAGISAGIKGTVTNLMQQQKNLKFIEINEQNATYYIASFRFTNEEVLNFKIDVKTHPDASAHTVKFTKTLYVDK